jgi:hypothetical protein
LTSAFGAGSAWAQATPEAAPPPPPPAAPPPAEVPPPPPPPAVVEVPPPPAAPPTNTETMPATKPDTLPPISVGAWLRVGSIFQKGSDPSSLGDWHMSDAYAELHAGGKIHKKVGVTLNLAANMLHFNGATGATDPGDALQIEDAIVSFDFQDEFHLWAGHLLVPVDRANASGPFFMIPWYYPGFFAASAGAVGAPHEGPLGRNNGAVVWGDINGGQVTYLAGVFDDGNVAVSPLFSGRVRIALLDKEPGFWGNGSYFGDKDLFSIGIGSQYQKSEMGKDYFLINGDVLFEKKLGGGSFFTAEGAYYHFNVDSGGVSDSMYALLAYATPTMGIGNIQPSARFQWLKVKDNTGDNPWNLDVGLAYLIKGPALRLMANFTHTDLGEPTINSLTFAAQAIFF